MTGMSIKNGDGHQGHNHDRTCFESTEIMKIFLGDLALVSKANFKELCPSLIFMALEEECHNHDHVRDLDHDHLPEPSWFIDSLYGNLTNRPGGSETVTIKGKRERCSETPQLPLNQRFVTLHCRTRTRHEADEYQERRWSPGSQP